MFSKGTRTDKKYGSLPLLTSPSDNAVCLAILCPLLGGGGMPQRKLLNVKHPIVFSFFFPNKTIIGSTNTFQRVFGVPTSSGPWKMMIVGIHLVNRAVFAQICGQKSSWLL